MKERTRRFVVAMVLMVCAGVSQGRVWYVDDDAVLLQDGTSWRTAFRTLQQALERAESGDIIQMGQGIYTPIDEPVPDSAGGLQFQVYMRAGGTARRKAPRPEWNIRVPLTIRGGYAGVKSTDPNQRDPQETPSVLSGDLAGDDAESEEPNELSNDPARRENAGTLLQCLSTTAEVGTVLDGLTLEGAVAGAVQVYAGNRVIVRDCLFQRNSAPDRGGALRIVSADVTLLDCVLRDNSAEYMGGAVYADGTPQTIRRDPMLVRCRLVGNWAGQRGGAIAGNNTLLNLRSCRLSQNKCGQEGGALYAVTSPVTVSACTFRQNQGGIGGAFYVASGVCSLENSVLAGNRAEDGHALALHDAYLSLTNCTLTANAAEAGVAVLQMAYGDHGGLITGQSRVGTVIANSILWNEGRELSDDSLSPEYSCIRNWRGGGKRIVTADPEFIDPLGPDGISGTGDEDLRLALGSPCINAGAHSGLMGGATQDLAGRPRVLGVVDMGAYEFGRIWYVDAVNGTATRRGSAPEGEGLSPELPHRHIQMALDRAEDGDLVLVHPGEYHGFMALDRDERGDPVPGPPGEYYGFQIHGKSIEVRGVADSRGVPVINSGFEVQSGARQPAVVSHLVIRNSETAIQVRAGANPLLQYLTVVNNRDALRVSHGAAPVVRNCIFHENGANQLPAFPVSYCCADRFLPGIGNIVDDPLFVDPEGDDYRLFSEGGRYSPFVDGFISDIVTSPCIDAGDPHSDVGEEPSPHGWRVNMGAYGGTRYASKSPAFGPWVVLTTPVPDAEIQGIIDLEAWASAATRIVAVQFFINDVIVDGNESRPGVWSAHWIASEPGYHTVMAVVMDARGNLAVSAPVTVTVTSAGSEGGRGRR